MTDAICSQCGRPLGDAAIGTLCDRCVAVNAVATDTVPPSIPADEISHTPTEPDVVTESAEPDHIPFRPWATRILVGINLLIFGLMVATGASLMKPAAPLLIQWGADFGPLTLTNQPWRMLSSAFIHIGLFHIVLNMVSLLFLGTLAEAIYKRTTYLFLYVVSGMAASVASLASFPITVSAGASGAIFGIVGALIATFKLGRLQLPPRVVKRELTTLIVFAALTILEGFFSPGLNNAAHLGGLAAGALIGVVIALLVNHRYDYRRARNFAITLTLLVVGISYFGVRYTRAFDVHMFWGREHLTDHKFPEAQREFEAASKVRPNSSAPYVFLGATYTRLGDAPRAEAAFRRSVELNPRDLTARFQLAVTYYSQHKLTDAADTMRQVIQAQPNDPQMHEFLAQILAEQGSMAEAQQEHERAIELLQQMQGR